MSVRLYFKRTWRGAVVRFQNLRGLAKARGWSLDVENAGTKARPIFVFVLDCNDGKPPMRTEAIEEVAGRLDAAQMTGGWSWTLPASWGPARGSLCKTWLK